MKIEFHRKFTKKIKKLPWPLREKINLAIERFSKNPFDPSLKNHSLSGKMKSFRAFSVALDMRIIFEEHHGYALVIMIDIGNHDQVYR